jgi:uncharacterized protein YndB with AHSA1/START domain
MTFSPADHLGATERSLSTTTRDGKDLRVLTVSRTYDASPGEVWDALTTAERINRWMLPVSGELRLGGRYQLEGNAGGDILECDAPGRLRITWEFGGGMSWVDLTLTAEDAGTRLRLDHSIPLDDVPVGEYGPGAVGIGWELSLLGLAQHFDDPTAVLRELEANQPPALLEFMTASGRAWGVADAAAGTDPEEARAAAERCVAAYTGAPGPTDAG